MAANASAAAAAAGAGNPAALHALPPHLAAVAAESSLNRLRNAAALAAATAAGNPK